MNLVKLFLEFLKIGGFSFGGGMGTLPYIYEMAERTGWLSVDYIGKILAVSQVTPGPLACNIGTITGFRVYGIMGAIIANVGFIIPAICFMTICYKLINIIKNNEKANQVIKIVRAAALAVMIGSSITLFKSAFLIGSIDKLDGNLGNILNVFNLKSIVLGIGIYFLCRWKKVNSLHLILISAFVAVIFKV